MILRMVGECEVLLREFADVLAYFKHLKEYVSYISKDVKKILFFDKILLKQIENAY